MAGLMGAVVGGLRFLCTAQVGAGRGAAIALTVALIVLAIGQLRPAGFDRPLRP